LRHARLWFRFEGDYKPLKNTKPPIGQALTDEDQQKLFEVAKSKPSWAFAYVAAILSFYCGLRACEIKGLRWRDVDWERRRLSVRRSKTPAGWRDPSLNNVCLETLTNLRESSQRIGCAEPEHFVLPWHGKTKVIDPSRPMASWRSAWRSIKKAAGLSTIRFHDGRHTALTRLAEAGQPDWVIQAQMGHVSPSMMKTYCHVRRLALDEAAKALEPVTTSPAPTVTSQATSHSPGTDPDVLEFVSEIGSSGWTRTSNPPVNSRMLCH
jgi:integrase